MLTKDGIPERDDVRQITPGAERLSKGPVAVIECWQPIPCAVCVQACPRDAITSGAGEGRPAVDPDKCIGCGICVSKCPGAAIFVVDVTCGEGLALVKLPFEFWPVPQKGQQACAVDRAGEEVGWFEVERVIFGGAHNNTWIVSLKVPRAMAMEIRGIKAGGYK